MTKDEYIRLRNEINNKQAELNHELWNLQNRYMRESEVNQFMYGEKILLHKRGESIPGFVVGCEIDKCSDEVILKLVECKKDGTPSKRSLYYFPACGDYVEKWK